MKNEILDEIYKYRQEYAESFGYDLQAMFNDLKKKEAVHPHRFAQKPITSPPQKKDSSSQALRKS